jgi:hypothetical protein
VPELFTENQKHKRCRVIPENLVSSFRRPNAARPNNPEPSNISNQVVSLRCAAFMVLHCKHPANPSVEGKGVQLDRATPAKPQISLRWQRFSRPKIATKIVTAEGNVPPKFGEKVPKSEEIWKATTHDRQFQTTGSCTVRFSEVGSLQELGRQVLDSRNRTTKSRCPGACRVPAEMDWPRRAAVLGAALETLPRSVPAIRAPWVGTEEGTRGFVSGSDHVQLNGDKQHIRASSEPRYHRRIAVNDVEDRFEIIFLHESVLPGVCDALQSPLEIFFDQKLFV